MPTHQPPPRSEPPRLVDVPTVTPPSAPGEAGRPRLREVNRAQLEWRPVDLDSLLPDEHRARIVWDYVLGLDLTPLYRGIQAVEGHAGAPATDPRLLLALWLQATLDGVGSARALARLCEEHVAYQWLCGGVSVNYHTLSDFRTAHVAVLDTLLTQSVATLLAEQLVTLACVAQDGVRVRASAGAASFRRRPRLEQCLAEADAQVQALRAELDTDPGATSQRQRAAQERAARERRVRVARALAQLPAVEATKRRQGERPETARVSTTDPDARVMKMADGGFRPAHNVQFATATIAQLIVGVDVGNRGSDAGQLAPMVTPLTTRYGQSPAAMLADAPYATHADLQQVHDQTCVYAPVPDPRDATRDRYVPRPDDPPAVAAWRQRMGTASAQALYKDRAATAECVNAQVRHRGLVRLLVRGLEKVRAIALWHALAHNLMRARALRTQTLALA
jgi:transposase